MFRIDWSSSTPEAYRADIDGLRAIAVLAVVLYHFDINLVAGGFVGVDIFFVISGYLITSILRRELQEGTFSFAGFYARRARRILPALVVVLIVSLGLGWVLLMPLDYRELGEQTGHAAVGLSNFYFLHHSGYFDGEADLQPLLHTWSLAVEEQFYLVWPFLLFAAYALGKRSSSVVAAVLSLLAVISFAWSTHQVFGPDAGQAFFMLPARAWELALGGLICFMPALQGAAIARLCEIGGLAVVLASAILLHEDLPFPGPAALPACLGAVALIWPKAQPFAVSKLLSSPPVVFVGLISYSLYLWHWPILVFYRLYSNDKMPNSTETAGLLALSLTVAVLSYRFVELPFRRRRSTKAAALAFSTSLASLAAGIVIVAYAGFPGRVPAAAAQLDAIRQQSRTSTFEQCGDSASHNKAAACVSDRPVRAKVMVVGDSHAGHFLPALRAEFPEIQFVPMTTSGCRPVLGFQAVTAKERACAAFVEQALRQQVLEQKFDAVILSARWRNGQAERLKDTIAHLRQHVPNVVVFGQSLEYKHELIDILVGPSLWRKPLLLAQSRLYDNMRKVDIGVREQLVDSGAYYFSVLDAICPTGAASCKVLTPDGVPYIYDHSHLTLAGARQVLASFETLSERFRTPVSQVP